MPMREQAYSVVVPIMGYQAVPMFIVASSSLGLWTISRAIKLELAPVVNRLRSHVVGHGRATLVSSPDPFLVHVLCMWVSGNGSGDETKLHKVYGHICAIYYPCTPVNVLQHVHVMVFSQVISAWWSLSNSHLPKGDQVEYTAPVRACVYLRPGLGIGGGACANKCMHWWCIFIPLDPQRIHTKKTTGLWTTVCCEFYQLQ